MSFARSIVALAAVLASQSAPAQEKGIVVPFDTIGSRHMIVEVVVNGKGPFTLIFDTGAPITLVGTKLAREAKVSGGGLFALITGLGQQKIRSIELGGIAAEQVDAVVLDHPIVDAIARATGKKLDGIVGMNVFGRYSTTIDYQAKTLTFRPSDHRPTSMFDALMAMMAPPKKGPVPPPVVAPKAMLGMAVAKAADDAAAGVVVETVYPDGPAAKAGVRAGDRLLAIDHRWTDRVLDCHDAARTLRPGETISIDVVRDGKKQTLKATVAAGF